MAEKKDSAGTTIILAACAVVLGFCVIAFGLQTLVCIESHRWALSFPYLKAIPRPLPTTVASPIQQRNLMLYGIPFAAPWSGPVKTTEGDTQSKVDFPSGPVIIFFNPSSEADIVGKIRDGDPQIYNSYQAIFGTGFFPDNYSLYAAVYDAATNEIWPFTSRSKAVRINTLLLWKLRFGMNGNDSVFSVRTDTMRGFQFGDPSRDRWVAVQLFDQQDGQLRILFTSRSGQPGTIPQADINCAVDSIKPPSAPR